MLISHQGWMIFNQESKELACETTELLEKLYNLSLEMAAVPEDWDVASLILIYKKGSRGDPGNSTPESHATRNGKVCNKDLSIYR